MVVLPAMVIAVAAPTDRSSHSLVRLAAIFNSYKPPNSSDHLGRFGKLFKMPSPDVTQRRESDEIEGTLTIDENRLNPER